MLATINGGPLADGKHTLTLLATDSNGNLAQPVTLSFILDTTPPAPVTPLLLASSDTGISDSDGITRITTPTFEVAAPAGSIVRLYADGTQVGQATANNGPVFITTTALTAGHAPDHRDGRGRRRQRERRGVARHGRDPDHAPHRRRRSAWTPRRRPPPASRPRRPSRSST